MPSQKPKILIAFQTVEEAYPLLAQHFDIIRPPKGRDFTKEELLERIGACQALCSVFDIPVDRALIDAGGDNLKMIANYAVGFNNIDIAYCQEKGIAVSNTPEAVVAPTAELAMALLLSVTRRVAEMDACMRQERHGLAFSRIDKLGLDLAGKTIGIIGFGQIGKAVAKRCQAFDMQVLYNKRTPLSKEEEKALGVSYASIRTICQTADVVSLHTPLTPDTKHLIDKAMLEQMKESAILLNTARGPVVEEKALVEALKSGKLAGAGLDVFENNDLPLEELYTLRNVVMTPHIGTQTHDARMAMAHELYRNLKGFFFDNGEGVSFVVDPRRP